MNSPSSPKNAGFSLVEIALSIGIIAFAFVGLMSLLPAGLTTFRRALDVSICMQIAQRIVAEAQEADFNVFTEATKLPPWTNPTSEYSFRVHRVDKPDTVLIRYFDEQGNEIVPAAPDVGVSAAEQAQVVYAVNVRVIPRVVLPTGSLGFPQAKGAGQAGNLAQVTIQIARNPSSVELPLNTASADDASMPERNLWQPKGGIDIFTYSAYIGRNQ